MEYRNFKIDSNDLSMHIAGDNVSSLGDNRLIDFIYNFHIQSHSFVNE